MVNGFTDNDDPRWTQTGWEQMCEFNPENQSLSRGQLVFVTYLDPERFKNQRSLVILDIRDENGEDWADLDGPPHGAPLWALVAAA